MKIKSNILYDLLDQNTGEQVTFVKTTTGYDGTVITSENEAEYVDGVIYKKLKATDGGGYAKRVAPGGYGFIEWFVGDDLSNGINNFNAIKILNKAGLKVKLPKGEIPLTTSTNTEVFENPNDLVWEGAGINKTKIVLQTKHSTDGGGRLRAYFMGNSSVLLKDLELSTLDFENGIKDQINSEYKFITINRPDNIIVDCEKVRINGSITFQYQHNYQDSTSTEQEVLDMVVKKISVRYCEFNYVSSLFKIESAYVTECEFLNNKINNLLGTILFAPEGGAGNKLVIWKNNYLENTIIPEFTTWYHCPVVVRCNTIFYTNNVVKELKNTDKTPRSQNPNTFGAETYSLYATALHLYFYNNTIINVLGQKEHFQDNCCFKVKGAVNVYCENNTITLDKQSLVDTGVISSVNAEYSTINKNTFVYCVFGSNNDVSPIKSVFTFKKNTIKIPYINYTCWVRTPEFDISDNTIEIEYVAIDRDGTEQIVFDHTYDLTALDSNEKSRFDNNTIIVNEVEDESKPVYILTNVSRKIIASDVIPRKFHSVSNNEFFGEGVKYFVGLNQSKIFILENNRTFGNCTLRFEDLTSSDPAMIPLANINFSLICDKINSNIRIMNPKLWGTSKVSVNDNDVDVIQLMRTTTSNWFYNDIVNSANPILFEVDIRYKDDKSVLNNIKYCFAQTSVNNCKYYNKVNGNIEDFDPRSTDTAVLEFAEKSSKDTNIGLFIELFSNRDAILYITGLQNYKEIEITSKVWSKEVNPATFYNIWLTPIDNIEQLLENKADKTFATTTTKGLIKAADIPVDSTAEDISTLVADFNNLLQRLRDQNTE